MNIIGSPALIGRDQYRSRQFSKLAAVLFLFSAVVYSAVVLGGLPDTFPFMVGPVVIALGVATLNAYLNDGLLVSALMTVAFAFGGIIAMLIDASLGPISYPITLTGTLSITLFFVGMGVGAFVIGAGSRRIVQISGKLASIV